MQSDSGIEAVASAAARSRVWIAGFSGALGGLLFGYDWVVIGGAKPFYEAYFSIHSPTLEAWAMSCALIGCLFGALFGGVLSDRKGRRSMLMASAIVFAVSSLGTACSGSIVAFVLWRILGGTAIGAASEVAPIFLAEIAPTVLRGRFVSMNQMAIVLGILAAQTANDLIARPVPAGMTALWLHDSWNAQWGWRWMFGVTAIPSLLFLFATLIMPESPRWLLARFRAADAMRAFHRLGVPDSESAKIRQQFLRNYSVPDEPNPAHRQSWSHPAVRRILLLGICIAVLQQWSGINILFAYAQDLCAQAGYSVSQALFQIVLTGLANLIFTLIAFSFVDRVGRRTLLLAGLSTLAAIYSLLGWMIGTHLHGTPVLLLLLAAIAAYAMTLAPVSWIVISEIYPTALRARAMSITVAALWIASFTLTSSFPLIRSSMGLAHTFWLYALICAAGCAILARWLPETRGDSLEDLEQKLYAKRESA
jgi:SP family sugar porter-like MFS transporter